MLITVLQVVLRILTTRSWLIKELLFGVDLSIPIHKKKNNMVIINSSITTEVVGLNLN